MPNVTVLNSQMQGTYLKRETGVFLKCNEFSTLE